MRWSAPNGNTTLFPFEAMKAHKKMQMPIGTGPLKSAERVAIEAEITKHSAKGASLTPQRLAGLTGASLELVRKTLANMLRYGVITNVGTQKAPAYFLNDKEQADQSASLANIRHAVHNTTYGGAELRPFDGRPGAMDAYKLPSVVNGKEIEPRRITAMCVGVK